MVQIKVLNAAGRDRRKRCVFSFTHQQNWIPAYCILKKNRPDARKLSEINGHKKTVSIKLKRLIRRHLVTTDWYSANKFEKDSNYVSNRTSFPIGVTRWQFGLFPGHHFAKIQQTIAHSSQRGIDTTTGNICNFFKAQIGKMAKNNHLSLFLR